MSVSLTEPVAATDTCRTEMPARVQALREQSHLRTVGVLAPGNDEGLVILTNGDRGGETCEPIVNACRRDGRAVIDRLNES